MNRDVTAALRLALQGHLSLRKSRLESFCVLVVGVLLSRTVNLSHLASPVLILGFWDAAVWVGSGGGD
jgi:hypothetical protein